MSRAILAAAISVAACFSTPAAAALPDPVKAMIDAAIATGDKAKVETVFDLAKQTQPDHVEEIEALAFDWRADQEEAKRLAERHKQEEIRQAGLLDLWSGEGQVGGGDSGFRAVGGRCGVACEPVEVGIRIPAAEGKMLRVL